MTPERNTICRAWVPCLRSRKHVRRINHVRASAGLAWSLPFAGWHRQTRLTVLIRWGLPNRDPTGKRVCPCHPGLGSSMLNSYLRERRHGTRALLAAFTVAANAKLSCRSHVCHCESLGRFAAGVGKKTGLCEAVPVSKASRLRIAGKMPATRGATVSPRPATEPVFLGGVQQRSNLNSQHGRLLRSAPRLRLKTQPRVRTASPEQPYRPGNAVGLPTRYGANEFSDIA